MKSVLVIFTVLCLLLIVLPACNGNGSEKTPPTSTSTVIATATPATGPSGPVKIGAIAPWSGPSAMSGLLIGDPIIRLVEWQVKQQGGILGGRDVMVVRYDNHNSAPEVQDGVKKLFYENKVSAIVWGGITIAEFSAGASICEQLKILYVPAGEPNNFAELQYTVNVQALNLQWPLVGARVITDIVKAKTVAFLGVDNADGRENLRLIKEAIEPAGIQIVYEDYIPLDASDYSSYLTIIKSLNPDVVYTFCAASEFYINIARQIMNLGGWGDIKVICYPGADNAKKMPGAEGWYLLVLWAPGMDSPGGIKFFNDYRTVNGRIPAATNVYFYNCLMTAVYAIQLAGTDTDRVVIAQAARSGKLEWDTPAGYAHFMQDGTSGLMPHVAHIENGNLAYVPLPD